MHKCHQFLDNLDLDMQLHGGFISCRVGNHALRGKHNVSSALLV